MAYDQDVISAFNRAARETGASARVRKALFAAGIVESGLRNLNYGDRDSLGPLQQRPSMGWQNARDPYKGALDFLRQAIPLNASGKYGSAGQLAQAVQRSAFPGRYDKRGAEADRIIAGLGASPSSGSPAAGAGGSSSVAPAGLELGQAGDFAGVLGQLLSKPQQQAAPVPVQGPAFSAAPVLPGGFTPATPEAAPARGREDRVGPVLSLLEALRGDDVGFGSPEAPGGAQAAPGVVEAVTRERKGQVALPESGKNPWGVVDQAGRSGLYLQRRYGVKEIGGYRESDPFPDHPSRKALDLMVYDDVAKGNAIVRDLTRNYKQHGVKYVIWNQRIWRPGQGWKQMADRGSPTQNHKDHVHVLYG